MITESGLGFPRLPLDFFKVLLMLLRCNKIVEYKLSQSEMTYSWITIKQVRGVYILILINDAD